MNISLESTKTTPMAMFNEGHIQIEGKSIPVVDPGFFNSLVNYTRKYSATPAPLTTVDIDFECINAYSKKSMMQFFRILEMMEKSGSKIVINWFYNDEDDAMLELGKIYQAIISIPFNFKTK